MLLLGFLFFFFLSWLRCANGNWSSPSSSTSLLSLAMCSPENQNQQTRRQQTALAAATALETEPVPEPEPEPEPKPEPQAQSFKADAVNGEWSKAAATKFKQRSQSQEPRVDVAAFVAVTAGSGWCWCWCQCWVGTKAHEAAAASQHKIEWIRADPESTLLLLLLLLPLPLPTCRFWLRAPAQCAPLCGMLPCATLRTKTTAEEDYPGYDALRLWGPALANVLSQWCGISFIVLKCVCVWGRGWGALGGCREYFRSRTLLLDAKPALELQQLGCRPLLGVFIVAVVVAVAVFVVVAVAVVVGLARSSWHLRFALLLGKVVWLERTVVQQISKEQMLSAARLVRYNIKYNYKTVILYCSTVIDRACLKLHSKSGNTYGQGST